MNVTESYFPTYQNLHFSIKFYWNNVDACKGGWSSFCKFAHLYSSFILWKHWHDHVSLWDEEFAENKSKHIFCFFQTLEKRLVKVSEVLFIFHRVPPLTPLVILATLQNIVYVFTVTLFLLWFSFMKLT